MPKHADTLTTGLSGKAEAVEKTLSFKGGFIELRRFNRETFVPKRVQRWQPDRRVSEMLWNMTHPTSVRRLPKEAAKPSRRIRFPSQPARSSPTRALSLSGFVTLEGTASFCVCRAAAQIQGYVVTCPASA